MKYKVGDVFRSSVYAKTIYIIAKVNPTHHWMYSVIGYVTRNYTVEDQVTEAWLDDHYKFTNSLWLRRKVKVFYE